MPMLSYNHFYEEKLENILKYLRDFFSKNGTFSSKRCGGHNPPPVLFALKSSKMIFSSNPSKWSEFITLHCFFFKKILLCLFTLHFMGVVCLFPKKNVKKSHMGLFGVVQRLTPPLYYVFRQ